MGVVINKMAGSYMHSVAYLLLLLCRLGVSEDDLSLDADENKALKLYTIEGSAEIMDGTDPKQWLPQAKILVDGGRYTGHFRASGDFKIHNIPPGSYLVEIVHPNFLFESARVDISSKSGKIRARRVNLLKPGSVSSLPYPLRFQTDEQASFFEKREQLNVLDMLKNPMVLFLVAPMILMLLLPRLLNMADSNTQKEMQDSMQMFQSPSSSMPSMEEMFTNFFGGGGGKKKSVTSSGSSNKKSKHKD